MILNEYNMLFREYFDFSDRETTKFLKYVNENDQQSQVLAALAGALYEKIVDKCDKIDFGSIPRSRGDITKVDGFNSTVECVNIIRKLVVEYKEDPSIIDIEVTAINNMKALRPIFIKGFNNNASFPMMYYNIMVASIQHSVSFLIAVAIQFVKDPDNKNISMALDKAAYRDSESNMILEQIAKMNKAYATGELEKLLRESVAGIRESVEGDEFSEEEIATTDDVTKEIEDAPTSEDTTVSSTESTLFEADDEEILDMASGEEAPEPEETPAESPFSDGDETEDGLTAGANNPDTLPDDDVEPTPMMPINGCGAAGCAPTPGGSVDGAMDEGQGSVVKRHYHKYYGNKNDNPNNGFGATTEASFKDTIKNAFTKDNAVKVTKKFSDIASAEGTKGKIKAIWNLLPGNNVVKGIAIGVAGLVFLIKVVIPFLRTAVSYFWVSVADLSESLAAQANLIEINALNLEADPNSKLSDAKKEKAVEKQIKIAQKLRSWSQKIAIKDKKVAKDVQKSIEDENRKNKYGDIQDNLPDDIGYDSVLF